MRAAPLSEIRQSRTASVWEIVRHTHGTIDVVRRDAMLSLVRRNSYERAAADNATYLGRLSASDDSGALRSRERHPEGSLTC